MLVICVHATVPQALPSSRAVPIYKKLRSSNQTQHLCSDAEYHRIDCKAAD